MMMSLLSFALWLVIVRNKNVNTYKWSEFYQNQLEWAEKWKELHNLEPHIVLFNCFC